MSSDWRLFALDVERPQNPTGNREQITTWVAQQVAVILGTRGTVDIVDVDISPDDEVVDKRPFLSLNARPVTLQNGGDLLVGQLPVIGNRVNTKLGVHSVVATNDSASGLLLPSFAAVVTDPAKTAESRVVAPDGMEIDMEPLRELYSALDVCIKNGYFGPQHAEAVHATEEYPLRIIEPGPSMLQSNNQPYNEQ